MLLTSPIAIFLNVIVIGACDLQSQDAPPSNMSLEEAREMFQQNFNDLDVTGDNLVDFDEFLAQFFAHDYDNNQNITLEEFLRQSPEPENTEILTAEFRFYDRNNNGVIDTGEIRNEFETIDINNDNNIEEEEFITYGTKLFVERLHPAFQTPIGK